jgi:hypothetical protein
VFDSGLGGWSVLRALHTALPGRMPAIWCTAALYPQGHIGVMAMPSLRNCGFRENRTVKNQNLLLAVKLPGTSPFLQGWF